MKNGHRRQFTAPLIVCFLLALLYANRETVLTSAAAWLNTAESPRKTDYVFVLNGEPNTRPFVAAGLIKAALASEVLLLPMKGATAQGDSAWPASHELSRQILLLQGVADEHIQTLPGECSTTFDEAQALARFLRSPLATRATVSVVSSDFHMRRTAWVFRRVLGDNADRVHFVAAPVDGFSAENWWRVEDGFVTYTVEYLKLLFYIMRYGDGRFVYLGTVAVGAATVLGPRWVRGFRKTKAAND